MYSNASNMVRTFIFSLILLIVIPFSLQAQTEKGHIFISAEMGVSLLASQWQAASSPAVIVNTIPAFLGHLDYAIIDVITIGGAFGYQKVTTVERNHTYMNTLGIIKTEDVNITLTRMNFAYRVLFHYVRNENLDMYSGIRMGLNYYQYSTSSKDINYSLGEESFNEFGFAPQLIGLGIRLYVVKDLAINTEIGIGWPSFFSFGLTYRL